MKPERKSQLLLGATRSQAKMHEFGVDYRIDFRSDPARLFILTIGLLGEIATRIYSENVDDEYLNTLRENLRFSAYFFDAYLQSKLNAELDPFLLLLGSASYYLCDLPGSSQVLANRLGKNSPDLECLGLEDLLLWLLQGDLSTYLDYDVNGLYGEHITGISQWLVHYFENGSGEENLFKRILSLRKTAYQYGTPRQLLFADVISAVVKERYENSTWFSLPRYSDLTPDQWRYVLQKETFIQELWPAQHLLGEHGIFRGRSATVQMPTSAGKTKATEIIIRSAFISGRTSLSVIVAPYRALCHEIRNSLRGAFHGEPVYIDQLSDVLQTDYALDRIIRENQVLVVTPEKLVYVLRHTPELAKHIGLLIYDEGHQFDNGTRGITYELLLTSLKAMVPEEVQTILISAVISNADSVGNWLNGDDSEVVIGTRKFTPTYRTVAFASWLDRLGRLEFVNQDDPEKQEFFVPRIIDQQQLQLRGKETKERVFPEKSKGKEIALYLGLKLVNNGGVAIFCGKKATVSSLCEKAVDVFERGFNSAAPIEFSDRLEIKRLHFLQERNLGANAIATRSAKIGIFAHHGNTPRGIRLAVEYAMKEGMAKFVICTSTLAQGVNLPIRYLIVTSIYQGSYRIKVRDFHNLIGRAGRSGMHTEGSVLFADPIVYDERGWRWNQVKELLEPSNSEPCASTILSIFEPLHSDNRRYTLDMGPLTFVHAYIESAERVSTLPSEITSQHADKGFTHNGLVRQVTWKMNIISTIESYLMAHWDDSESGMQEDDVAELARGTLAFFLADDEQQVQIIELFILLAQNIEKNITEPLKRKAFGKTLYGVQTSIAIENWVTQHIENLVSCSNQDELLETLWPLLAENVKNAMVQKSPCEKKRGYHSKNSA